MASSIAEYYTNELDNWKDAILLHLERISESEERLNEILRYNTIPNLAANVEHHLNLLFLSRQNLLSLDRRITSFQQKLISERAPVKDELVTEDVKKQQKELRTAMYKTEKEYLETKYANDDFIDQTVNRQNKKTDKNHL